MAKLSDDDRSTIERAGMLVKFDLGSQMVTELTSLAGIMARDYALHAGESLEVAQALHETELPRHAGDAVPDSLPGSVLALADRIDMLVGLVATMGVPTGSSDPFALRRAALGVIAICRAHDVLMPLSLTEAFAASGGLQPVEVPPATLKDLATFVTRRFEQVLVDESPPVDWVRAVLPHADRPYRADQMLAQLRVLVGQQNFCNVVDALQRSRRIVPAGTPAGYDPGTLTEPAELRLHDIVTRVGADLDDGADLQRFVETFGRVVEPLNAFFDKVFVMVDDQQLRRARLGLLASIEDLGAGVLDWHELRL
ncbi:MAG: glycine--tRNA ligase subunit beta [Pseudonocardiaceae bacterium]